MLAALYKPLLFIHILANLLYMMSHGASAVAAFRLRRETALERIRALLDLSAYSFTFMYLSLLAMFVAGIALGFAGRWWATGWIWASIVLLIAILVAMTFLASNHFHRIRKAVGLPYREGNKEHPPVEPASSQEIYALLTSVRAHLLTVIGIGGWALILYLMIFKPF